MTKWIWGETRLLEFLSPITKPTTLSRHKQEGSKGLLVNINASPNLTIKLITKGLGERVPQMSPILTELWNFSKKQWRYEGISWKICGVERMLCVGGRLGAHSEDTRLLPLCTSCLRCSSPSRAHWRLQPYYVKCAVHPCRLELHLFFCCSNGTLDFCVYEVLQKYYRAVWWVLRDV